MSWSELATIQQSHNRTMKGITDTGLYEKQIDTNNDNIFEATQTLDKDESPIKTSYDFDSNGAIDYAELYGLNGDVAKLYYTNNPENNDGKVPSLLDKVTTFFKKSKLDEELKNEKSEYLPSHKETVSNNTRYENLSEEIKTQSIKLN